MKLKDIAFKGFSVVGVQNTIAPDPRCCSNPAALCGNCAMKALRREGFVRNQQCNQGDCPQPCSECPKRETCPRSTVANSGEENFAPFGRFPGEYIPEEKPGDMPVSHPQPMHEDPRGFAPFGLPSDYLPEEKR